MFYIFLETIITGEPTHTPFYTTSKVSCSPVLYISFLKREEAITLHYQLCSTHLLYSNTNQQLLKRTSAIKVATMIITDNFGSYHMPNTKSTLFAVTKDEGGHW